METQLWKGVPELCVKDVLERVAEVEMSSTKPVGGDPLPHWLQPFDENLVGDEEQRVDCVEVHGGIQDDDQEREGIVAQGMSSTATSTQASQSAGGSGTRTDAHPPTAAGVYIALRGAGRSEAHRRRARQDEEEREQHITTWSIDYAFMIDNGDLCTREEMERTGWDKTRDAVLVSVNLATGGIRAHLVSAKGNGDAWIAGKRSRTTSKNLDTVVRLFVSSRIKNQRLLTFRGQ